MQFLPVLAGQGSISENVLEMNHKKLHASEEKPGKCELIKCEGPTKTAMKSPYALLMQSNDLIRVSFFPHPFNATLIASPVEVQEGIYTETTEKSQKQL